MSNPANVEKDFAERTIGIKAKRTEFRQNGQHNFAERTIGIKAKRPKTKVKLFFHFAERTIGIKAKPRNIADIFLRPFCRKNNWNQGKA